MKHLLAGAAIFWSVCGAGPALAQGAAPRVFGGAPAAPWIFSPSAGGNDFGVFHFRRVFELSAKPENFVVHVSADNRYRLFVNGEEVSSGPQRSDLMHWRYETVDVGPHLRAGRNVIAALVWNWGPDKPVAQFSRQTAFLLQGNSLREAVVNSGPEWRVLRNEGYAPIPVLGDAVGGYYAAPPGEAIDARRNPWGWTQTDFTDDGWIAAAAGRGPRANRTQLRASNPFGEAGGWQLMPRSIPPMEQTPVRFATVRRSEGIAPDTGFLRGTSDFVVPAKTRTVILLDQGHLTNAFAVLETSGGAELGVPTFAEHYRSLAQKVRDGVRTASWDPPRRLFRDRPDGTTYSQQANVMAVLTDAVAPAGQAGLMERVLSDTTLTQSTYYFSYYQLEALRKAGLGDRYVEQLAPWRGMLALGLTTVPETPEPTRSDSHAWSAHPNYGLLATVLGVRPAEPGFKSVRIAPNLGPLRRVEGRVPHPRGEIVVRLERTDGGGLRGEVTLPEGLTGVMAWGRKETALRGGRQEVSF